MIDICPPGSTGVSGGESAIRDDRTGRRAAHPCAGGCRLPERGMRRLLGRRDGTRMLIVDVTSARNMWTERSADRYDLDPVDFIKADRDARSRGLDIAGIWHSHPDHPARPSQFDTDRAWLDYVYIICRTTESGAEDVNAFALEGEGAPFAQIALDISPVPGGGK